MSQGSGDSKGCAGWFKWLVGIVIAVLGAGGGIVALLNYFDTQDQQKWQQYYSEMEAWENFSPSSLTGTEQNATLGGLDSIDFETGLISSNPPGDRQMDLLFGCWTDSYESLRATDGTSWVEAGARDFQSIRYRELRDSEYVSFQNPNTGYNDLYFAHMSNVPGENFIYFIRTVEGNVVKFQISGYELIDNNPLMCRNMYVRYEVFPVVSDPPRPYPPD